MLVCTPDACAVDAGNHDLEKYLYRGKVNISQMIEQHMFLQKLLAKLKLDVIDISQYIPSDFPIESRANLVFVRDPMIVTPKGIVLGRMKEVVRQEEVVLIQQILNNLGKKEVFIMEEPGTLEGGDYLPCSEEHSFLGIGQRTNKEAAMMLMNKRLFGTKKVVFVYARNPDSDMHRIHLDCYFGIIGERSCIVWQGAVEKGGIFERFVDVYSDDGHLIVSSMPLREYLDQEGFLVTVMSDECHYRYGCNIVLLPNECVLTQDTESFYKIPGSIFVPFREMHQMYGGLHCATQYLP